MIFSYGDGSYVEGSKKLEGLITLGEHKVYLRTSGEDLTATYVPLEKIDQVRLQGDRVLFHVRPTISSQYVAAFCGQGKRIKELTKDIVKRRGFKKKFLKTEWYEAYP